MPDEISDWTKNASEQKIWGSLTGRKFLHHFVRKK